MSKRTPGMAAALCAALACVAASGRLAAGEDGQAILTVDHYVRTISKVPAIAGQTSTIYVREKVQAGTALRGATAADRVVLLLDFVPEAVS